MIKKAIGNLVRDAHNYDVIVHGANCFCIMGAGIALQIKNKFPEAYDVDCATIKGDRNKLGDISCTVNTVPTVVNAYTQYWLKGRNGEIAADYTAIREALLKLKIQFYGKKIGIPMIGAGLAGGDWNKIEAIINDVLGDQDVTIVEWDGLD